VREQKAGVDLRTARPKCRLHLALRLRFSHNKPIAKRVFFGCGSRVRKSYSVMSDRSAAFYLLRVQ
jgi:hypothetical protein